LSIDTDLTNNDRPLSEWEQKVIRWKHARLINEITIEELMLDVLLVDDCINSHHKDAITQCPTRSDKIRQLFEIQQRRSFAQYICFVDCLYLTNPDHVGKILESVGGLNTTLFLGHFFLLILNIV